METTDIDPGPGTDLLVLQQVARVVSRGDDAESRIQDILRHLAQSVGLVRGRVLLADPGTDEIYIRYAHGLTAAELERGRYRIGEGVSGRVFRTGEAALIANMHDEPGQLARALVPAAPPPEQVAFLAVPIVRAHLPVGVLAAHRLRSRERPARGDLALLEVIGTMIGQILCAQDQAESPIGRPMLNRHPVRSSAGRDHHGGDFDDPRCDLLLRTAEHWHSQGRLHQAADGFLNVARQWPSRMQALTARARLLDIARYYEGRGASRLALDVLERLQRVLDGAGGSGGNPAWGHGPDAADDDDAGSDRWDSYGGGISPSNRGRFELRPSGR